MLSLQERHQKILDMLNNQGEVRVNELSRLFEVSEVCIRNDLSELEMQLKAEYSVIIFLSNLGI